ncbi:hypothetical protein [Halomarina rubra]|uniref:Uncharacterized protein n=1 Tax=Halomarina rubra TaxID=2071873 RepID=A0ABD6AVP5_9EURY|nr:hypothetical protein [Halomarina rubra]
MKEIRLNKSMSYRTYPHRCEPGSLDFTVREYSLNGESTSEVDGDRLIDVTEYEGWETLSLELEVTIPEGLLGKVFPEFGEIPGMLAVTVHCRDTYLRDRLVLRRDPISSGTYSKTWEFNAQEVTGSIDLRPLLLRTTDAEDSGAYATDAGVFVADGERWRVELNDDSGEGEDLFDIRGTEFSSKRESNPASRFPAKDRLYYLDLESDAEIPVLWLNEDHEEVVPLLQSPEGQYEKLTSELAWNQVMTPVWTRLITIAATQYDSDDEEWPLDWQGAVFDKLHDAFYEDHSPEKAAERLQEELSESIEIATKRIDDAVQALLDPAEYYTKHVRTLSDK